ncbi:hypothetical protein BOTBODRAFT_87112, partial [Botryobasidium botryosum FD-172 SS1]
LVNAGANVNAQTSRSRQAPLHRAVQIGSLAAIRILVDSGADLNSVDSGADVNAKDSHGETPLHYASRRGLSLVTKLLLESGADPHSRDAQGRTP